MSIDFTSLEPRVALAVQGHKIDCDVYTKISNDLFSGKLDRKIAKLATIAALYGISFKKFSDMSGCKSREVLTEVKKFFRVRHLESLLIKIDI